MSELVDGNWVDMATIAVAILYAAFRCWLDKCRRSWESFAGDVSYGVVIFPMLLLSLTAISTKALQMLLTGNKIVISLAGLFSLIVILKRTFEKTNGQPDKPN